MNEIVEDDVRLTNQNYKQYANTKMISGKLTVSKGTFVLPNLETVSEVVVLADGVLQLPKCDYVVDGITVKTRASLFIGGWGEKIGRVTVNKNGSLVLLSVTEIMSLNLEDPRLVDIPKLISITGSLYLSGGTVELPTCRQVFGKVVANGNSTLHLPVCHTINGGINAGSTSTIRLPQCTSAGQLSATSRSRIELNALKTENAVIHVSSKGEIVYGKLPSKHMAINYQGLQGFTGAAMF